MVQTLPLYVVTLWITHSPKVTGMSDQKLKKCIRIKYGSTFKTFLFTGNILMEVINQEENAPLILRIKLFNKSIPELLNIFKPPVEVPNKVEWTNLLSNVLVGKQIV